MDTNNSKNVINNSPIIVDGDFHQGDVITSPSIELLFSNIKLKSLEFYISRSFLPVDKNPTNSRDSFFRNFPSLAEFHKKIILLGDAGFGKTIELESLQIELINRGFQVCFLKLKNYEDYDVKFIIPNYNPINQSKSFVVIDGLDELSGLAYSKAIKSINALSNQYPNIAIIVSCRTNIYNQNLEQFRVFVLQKFTDSDIEKYLEYHLNHKKNHFLNLIPSGQIKELIRIPFYLDKAVKYYQENERLPKDVIVLLEYFVDESLKVRINDDSNLPISKPEREKCLRLIQKLAFIMECQGINSLSIESFQKLIGEETVVKLVFEKSSLIHVNNNQVQFSHRIFQEYFAATVLAQSKKFKTIRSNLANYPRKSKLKSNWLNVVSYLVQLLDKKENIQKKLLNWLEKDNLKSLIRMEKEGFSKEFRERIFLKIFHKYKKREWLFRYDIKLDQLVDFGGYLIVLEKLILELDEHNPIESRVNVLELIPLFEKIELTTSIRDLIKNKLLPLIFENDNSIPLIRSLSIQAYSNLIGFEELKLEKLVGMFLNSEHQPTREAVRNAIITSRQEDKFIEELLVQFGISINQKLNVNKFDSNHIGNTLKGIKELDSVLKYLKFYQQNFDNTVYFSFRLTSEEVVKKINQEFINDKILFTELMNSFVLRLDDFWDNINTHIFEWIIKSNNRHDAFLFLYNYFPELESWVVHRLAVIADVSSIKFFANEFINKKISRQSVEVFQKTLDEFRKYDLLSSFNELVNRKENIPLPNSEKIDNELTEQQVYYLRKKKILFDKEFFINQVLMALKNEKNINNEVLNKVSQQNLILEIYQSEIICGLGRVIKEGEIISKKELVDKIYKHWDCCISAMNIEMAMRFGSKRDLQFDKEEKGKIKSWCRKQIEKGNIDFRGLNLSGNILNRWDYRFFERCFFTFCNWFKTEQFEDFEEKLYLDMLSFIPPNHLELDGIFDFVKSKVDSKKIADRVLENLVIGIKVKEVLENHLRYTWTNKISQAKKLIPKYLRNKELGNRYLFIEIYLGLDGDITYLENLLEDEIDDDLKWTLVRFLVKKRSKHFRVKEILIEGFNKEEDEGKKIGLCSHLLTYGNLDALRYRVKPVLESSNWNIDIFNRDEDWTNIDGLKIIVGVYLFSFSKEKLVFKNDRFLYGFAQRAFSGIRTITFHQDNFSKVKKKITQILANNKLELGVDSNIFPSIIFTKEAFNNLRRDWDLLREEYFRKESRKFSSEDAQGKYFELIGSKSN